MNNLCKESSKTEFIFSDTTDFYADSVEWCPFENYAHFLVCGTYQLEENELKLEGTQTRKGNINLYKLVDLEERVVCLEKQHVFNCSGVLDIKWCPELIEVPHLAVACSDGKILHLKLLEENNSTILSLVRSENLAEKEKNMILSLDWSSESNGNLNIIASDTSGSLNYIEVQENTFHLMNSWKAHDFECWICAFDYSQPNVIYSGGDDCLFKGWDFRHLPSPTFVNKKHLMGVTAISKSKKNENLLTTGSYDENIFLWDTRSMKSPMSEASVGGGIWRLKWHPHDSDYLLSASMHNGFHVLSVTDYNLKVINHYHEHKSLAYGVDWCALSNQGEESSQEMKSCKRPINYIASCSFYDKLLHLWKIKW